MTATIKNLREESPTEFQSIDMLTALKIEFDKYLIQRINSPQPHLTFKKFLAGKREWDLCDYYDQIRMFEPVDFREYLTSGQINYSGSLYSDTLHSY